MNKICTSLEQSKKLIELGVDINTADMYYQYFKSYSPSNGVTTGHCDIPVIGSWKEHHISIPDPAMHNADIPAWSLTALLELMPSIKGFRPLLALDDNYITYPIIDNAHFSAETPLDAAFEMICWLKENGKL